jgi:hypothetical protein
MSETKAKWNKWYAAVITLLLLQIVFYYLFTQHWA